MRTYFKNELDNNELIEAASFYADRLSENWLKLDVTNQAKAAMVLHRMGKTKVAASILAALKEKSLSSEALGIYWKQQAFGTAAAIKSQAMLIAAFDEISTDT
ncbi:hypothetical protein RZS08_62020, partial [Arthrospira platensis SPKY1]|nr:hypothetical protein [Arthrospira platensis SPKY1]